MSALLLRRWHRRFRRLVWRALRLSITAAFIVSTVWLTLKSGLFLLQTGKTSFAIVGLGFSILLGLTLLALATTRVKRITHIHNHFPTPDLTRRAKKG